MIFGVCSLKFWLWIKSEKCIHCACVSLYKNDIKLQTMRVKNYFHTQMDYLLVFVRRTQQWLNFLTVELEDFHKSFDCCRHGARFMQRWLDYVMNMLFLLLTDLCYINVWTRVIDLLWQTKIIIKKNTLHKISFCIKWNTFILW